MNDMGLFIESTPQQSHKITISYLTNEEEREEGYYPYLGMYAADSYDDGEDLPFVSNDNIFMLDVSFLFDLETQNWKHMEIIDRFSSNFKELTFNACSAHDVGNDAEKND